MKRVIDSSLDQVRIADLIAELGINRNTFYYHFSSKYDVALWVLQEDLAAELESCFSQDDLLYLSPKDGTAKSQRIPYYVRVESGAHALDASGFTKALVRCTLRSKAFYRKIFNQQETEFARCFIGRYYPAIEEDIRFVLGGRYMPDETVKYLATMGSQTLLMTVQFNLNASEEHADLLDDRINPFWNFFHESLSASVTNHPINRYRRKSAKGNA